MRGTSFCFFFSSRRRHTRCSRDWSSDVCSSDLGRLLFLGNAAHSLSLFGTSEVNSGAQDAWNLVWKLALVRAGLALETLLDTYHEERHAAAIESQQRASEMMGFLSPVPGMAKWRR